MRKINDKAFIKASRNYQKRMKQYIRSNFGRKCGHIGREEISLDCAVCKVWLSYEFLSWFIDLAEELKD